MRDDDDPDYRKTCFQFDRREAAMFEEAYREQDGGDEPPYSVEAITKEEARAFIKRFEYLGTVGRNWARYAARNAKGELAAVATFGAPVPMPPGTIVLERGACAPWAHRNTASWFIPQAVTRAAQDRGWHTFKAYADIEAGEWGTVYQACNWLYLGQTPDRLVGGKPRPREYFRRKGSDGPWITETRWGRQLGYKIADVHSGEWERKFVPPKLTYVHIEAWTKDECGRARRDKRVERALRAPFEALSLPYPPAIFARDPPEDFGPAA